MARKGKLKTKASEDHQLLRPVRYRRYKYLFLIVCEDEKTEPAYFESYKTQIPDDTLYLKTVGSGRDPKGVVQKAVEERDRLKKESRKEVDYTWAVFDKDDADKYPKRTIRFEEALKLADEEGIELACSNEVFELWLLLHLDDVESGIPLPRNEVYKKLEDSIRKIPKHGTYIYNHTKYNPKTVELILKFGDVETAVLRAEKLMQAHKGRKLLEANPSTRVYKLVRELINLIGFFSYRPS